MTAHSERFQQAVDLLSILIGSEFKVTESGDVMMAVAAIPIDTYFMCSIEDEGIVVFAEIQNKDTDYNLGLCELRADLFNVTPSKCDIQSTVTDENHPHFQIVIPYETVDDWGRMNDCISVFLARVFSTALLLENRLN